MTQEFECVGIIDDKEINCKFDVDFGCPATRWEPGDPGGLYITEAVVDGKNIVDELSEKDIETLTQYAEEVFMNEYYADYETDRLEYLRDMNQER